MDIREAFSDVPVIDLTGGGVKKAQGVIDVSAPPNEEVVEEVEPQVEDVPTSANLKQEIFDYLVARGEDPNDLDGMTKAELLELV